LAVNPISPQIHLHTSISLESPQYLGLYTFLSLPHELHKIDTLSLIISSLARSEISLIEMGLGIPFTILCFPSSSIQVKVLLWHSRITWCVTHYFGHPGDVSTSIYSASQKDLSHKKINWFPSLQDLFLEGRRRIVVLHSAEMPALNLFCGVSTGCYIDRVRQHSKTEKKEEVHESSRRNLLEMRWHPCG